MTVIAWDGKILAADKRACAGGLIFKVTKISILRDHLVGGSGELSAVRAMFNWFELGGDPKNLPDCQKDKDRWSPLLVISPNRKIYRHEQDGFPYEVEEPFYAIGSGRDFAIATMAMGGGAIRAVEIASNYDSGCGDGIDILSFEEN